MRLAELVFYGLNNTLIGLINRKEIQIIGAGFGWLLRGQLS